MPVPQFDVFDPLTDPGGSAAAFRDAQAEPMPEMAVAQNMVQLPGGYMENGRLYKTAEVRELNGDDEEAMSRIIAGSSSELFDAYSWVRLSNVIMERGLVAIGGIKATDYMLKNLLLGDRTAILLGIRIATWGADYPADIVCSACGKKSEIIFELDKDIEYTKLNDFGQHKVVLRNGQSITFHIPTYSDQEFGIGNGSGTKAEMNTRLFSRVITDVDDIDANMIPGGAAVYARQMGQKDRATLLSAIMNLEFGPKLGEVTVACPECESNWNGALVLPTLF